MKISLAHRITAFFLTIVLFSSIITDTSIIIDFAINQDTIAKTLCVQKDNQQGCQGKCQLVKALKKDLKNGEMPMQNNENGVTYTYIQPVNNFNFTPYIELQPKNIIDGTHYNIISKYFKVSIPPPLFS